MVNNKLDLWITEISEDTMGLSFKINKTLFSGQSKYQQVDIIETCDHGKILLNDGLIMISERDEFIYHEMIAHVPLFVHPNPQNVLIIGGGDGGTAREVLKHKSIEKVVMVEIDKMVVDSCRKYIPSVSCSLDDPRLDIIIDDGVKYVENTNTIFDIVIVDSTDPIGPAEPLFNNAFYKNVASILSDNGILITQAESPFYYHDIQKSMLSNQRPFFNKMHIYFITNITYPGGLWGFGFASKELCPIKNFNAERVDRAEITMKYYNKNIHKAAFILPTFIEQDLKGIINPISY
jgi:spermidine synthase